jgi:conjugative relaxase-like TrwC/TraI family protein
MTMSIAKLSADAGVKYLLRTTAHGDMNVRNLTDYYTKSGNPPGTWYGNGLGGIDLVRGAVLTDGAAKTVFETARHPFTGEPLGRPHGHRTIHAGKGPGSGTSTRSPVAGFDLTFSVPKSVSVLWALSPQPVRDQVLDAHHHAVQETLVWLEARAIGTRTGHNGVAHVPVQGAIAAAFDHWESRAGDPQLHTHLVIANRVQRASDGAWTTLDSRALYKAVVAASAHYNGLLYDELHRELGTECELRAPSSAERNPSRELVGVDTALIAEFSARSRAIELEKDRLIRLWNLEHGKNPSDTTVLKLRQQATLATRAAKSTDPVPLGNRLDQWHRRAAALGCRPERLLVETIHRSRTLPQHLEDLGPEWFETTGHLVQDLVARKRATWNRWNLLAEAERTCAGLRMATTADRTRMIDRIADTAEACSVALNDYRYTLPLDAGPDIAAAGHTVFDPPEGRIFTDVQTLADEAAVMAAAETGDGPGLDPWDAIDALNADTTTAAPVPGLAPDQQDAVIQVLTSRNRLDTITGPAGTGKTSTLQTITRIWQQTHGTGSVLALAPAAVSADVLGTALALPAENVAKWLYESDGAGTATRTARYLTAERILTATSRKAGTGTHRVRQAAIQTLTALAAEQARWQLKPGQLVIIDEASMVSTYQLAAITAQATAVGAKVLLVGDPAQLDAIDAGGILGWLERTGHTAQLTSIHRFSHAWESAASLKLRTGDYDGVADYRIHGRIEAGAYEQMVESAYARWRSDRQAGLSSILIAADNDTVQVLNRHAQADLAVAGTIDSKHTVPLSDGLYAGRGDIILARRNDRRIRDSEGNYIRNGTVLTITGAPNPAGTLSCQRMDTGAALRLDAGYLARSAELGYATTAHRSQGITVDTGHSLISEGRLTRELLYVSMTRGRESNTAYVIEPEPDAPESLDPTGLPHWPQILGQALAAEGAEHTAHETRQQLQDQTDTLAQLAAEHDYLTQIAAAEQLQAFLTARAPDRAAGLVRSPSWNPAVALWKRLGAVNPGYARQTVLDALTPSGGAHDSAAILHSRLAAALGSDRYSEHLVRVPTNRPDLIDLMNQVEKRMTRRAATVAGRAAEADLPWKRHLFNQLQIAGAAAESWNRVLREVAIFRDRWDVTDQNLPLGTQPAWEELQMTHHRDRILASIAASRNRGLDDAMVGNRLVGSQPQRASAQYDGPQF